MTNSGRKSRVRILIADGYPFFRRGLRTFIEEQSDFEVVGEAEDGEEMLRLCEALRPEIVLLDLNLPGADGVAPINALRERFPRIRQIVFATPDDGDALGACIETGVGGCVMKTAEPPMILSAIRAVAGGGNWLQRELTSSLFREVQRARHAGRERVGRPLSDRELEVLKLLAEGLRNYQIAQSLFISERTVKVHIANIFSKLQLHDRVQAARYAIRAGLVRV